MNPERTKGTKLQARIKSRSLELSTQPTLIPGEWKRK